VYYSILMKWLILLLLIWLVWRLLRVVRRDAPAQSPDARTARGEAMRPCAHCGLNVPLSETVSDAAGMFYCTESHRRLGPAKPRQP
jgi:uncharacterized protein